MSSTGVTERLVGETADSLNQLIREDPGTASRETHASQPSVSQRDKAQMPPFHRSLECLTIS
jgi:hypothetical protein